MSLTHNAPFVLVDGSSYLFRAFHALPPLTNSKGAPTGAIYGVINMLRKLIKDYQPALIAVIFDSKEKNFRHEIFPEYKANRTVMPSELAPQIPPLFEIIKAMGLPLIVIPGIEADDIIGTLACRASEQGLRTVISTGDKDMAQLVDDKITLVNTMSETVYDRAGVIKKFEVTPEQMIDYLSLIGDSVDNIPGVYKVGPKTAVKWLQQYHSLDNIVANADSITGKVGENLRAAIADLPLFKQLITIDTTLNIPYQITDLKPTVPDYDKLRELFGVLEFRGWLKQLTEQQVQEQPEFVAAPPQITDYKIIANLEDFNTWIKRIEQAPQFAISIQADDEVDYMCAKLIGIAISIEPNAAVYIPLGHDNIDAIDQLSLQTVLATLKPLFIDASKIKIVHNLKFVKHILANYELDIKNNIFDTMMASYVLNSVSSRHAIDDLALEYLQHEVISYEDIAGKGAKQIDFNQIAIETAGPYAAEAADIALKLYQQLAPKLAAASTLNKVFTDIEMPLIPILFAMERHGVLIDIDTLNKQSLELAAHIDRLEKEAYVLADQEFNLGSPKQLQEILFTKLQLPVIEKTPTGQPSTGENVLQELAENYLLPKIILEYRSLSKLKSTYTDKLPLQVNARTGRIHTSYHQAVTATGRLSSTDPNLQNIPIRTNEGKRIRAAFIAQPGYKMVSADYSQIELRIMAHLSGDQNLINTFLQGLDVHRATASEVFNVPKEEVTEDQRRHSKAINFGLIYGMSSFGLAKQLGISREKAEIYIETYFERFPGVRAYMERTRQLAADQGYVETLFGRRLYLPDIRSSKVMLKRAAERAAINAPLQGAQSDIIKMAMLKISDWLQTEATDAYMIMQVHDELIFEIPEAKVAAYSKHIAQLMSDAAQINVNLEVGIGVGNNWDEAH